MKNEKRNMKYNEIEGYFNFSSPNQVAQTKSFFVNRIPHVEFTSL